MWTALGKAWFKHWATADSDYAGLLHSRLANVSSNGIFFSDGILRTSLTLLSQLTRSAHSLFFSNCSRSLFSFSTYLAGGNPHLQPFLAEFSNI